MKFKYVISISIISIISALAVLFCACGTYQSYPFYHDEDEITGIQIVNVQEDHISLGYEIEKEIEIEQINKFILDFKELTFYVPEFIIGDPASAIGRGLLFIYRNGDLEFITACWQDRICVSESKEEIKYLYAMCTCDEQEFNDLLNKYL